VVLTDPVVRPAGWDHREISANGARFHAVVAGSGPAVLLLHGYPQYWWAWRHQITALADAGYTAIAMDLRGCGGSDKPPRGYDPLTMVADAAGLLRALGVAQAAVVGTGYGGALAWTLAAAAPSQVTALAVAACPHPLVLRSALRDPGFLRRNPHLLAYQVPIRPERKLVADDAAEVGRLLRDWSAAPDFPDPHDEQQYRAAMQADPSAFCWMETFRWLIRSLPRNDGRRWVERVSGPIRQPVLLIAGQSDPVFTPALMAESRRHVVGPLDWHRLPRVGHFVFEEAATDATDRLLEFLGRHH
jgi:pimeloyl-ACP methyl ester carboxylesterase